MVGATAPEELARVRAAAPGLAFLVPGVGAALEPVVRDGPALDGTAAAGAGGGLLVNFSRAIASAAGGSGAASAGDPATALAATARDWAKRLPVLL